MIQRSLRALLGTACECVYACVCVCVRSVSWQESITSSEEQSMRTRASAVGGVSDNERCSHRTAQIRKYTHEPLHVCPRCSLPSPLNPAKTTARSYLTPSVLKSCCRSQLPHKPVHLSFTITSIKNKLTDLCWNWLLHNDLQKSWCEMNMWLYHPQNRQIPYTVQLHNL